MFYIILTGGNYNKGIKGVEQYLADVLVRNRHRVIIIQYPRFINFLKFISFKSPIIIKSGNKITVNSLGLPWGRRFPLINEFNYKLNIKLIKKHLKSVAKFMFLTGATQMLTTHFVNELEKSCTPKN